MRLATLARIAGLRLAICCHRIAGAYYGLCARYYQAKCNRIRRRLRHRPQRTRWEWSSNAETYIRVL